MIEIKKFDPNDDGPDRTIGNDEFEQIVRNILDCILSAEGINRIWALSALETAKLSLDALPLDTSIIGSNYTIIHHSYPVC